MARRASPRAPTRRRVQRRAARSSPGTRQRPPQLRSTRFRFQCRPARQAGWSRRQRWRWRFVGRGRRAAGKRAARKRRGGGAAPPDARSACGATPRCTAPQLRRRDRRSSRHRVAVGAGVAEGSGAVEARLTRSARRCCSRAAPRPCRSRLSDPACPRVCVAVNSGEVWRACGVGAPWSAFRRAASARRPVACRQEPRRQTAGSIGAACPSRTPN